MRLLKKLTGIVLVGCMLCLMSLPAFAASLAPQELSLFAGQDKVVHLVVASPDGTVQKECTFNVAIPENATKADEHALINAAARAQSEVASNMSARSSSYTGDDLISQEGPFTIASAGAAQVVGGGTLQHNYQIIYVQLDGVTTHGLAGSLNIRIESDKNTNVYTSGTLRGDGTWVYMIDGYSYGGGILRLHQGEDIDVWASVNTGYIDVSDVYVSCSETY